MDHDRSNPNCPICGNPKEKHTPSEALVCFDKIRDDK